MSSLRRPAAPAASRRGCALYRVRAEPDPREEPVALSGLRDHLDRHELHPRRLGTGGRGLDQRVPHPFAATVVAYVHERDLQRPVIGECVERNLAEHGDADDIAAQLGDHDLVVLAVGQNGQPLAQCGNTRRRRVRAPPGRSLAQLLPQSRHRIQVAGLRGPDDG
jgi:hypothetical protein